MKNINTRASIGLILIVLGLIIFLGNLQIITDDYTLFMIAGGFFLAYFISGKKVYDRKVGFLVPALIILMIAVFDKIDNYLNDQLFSCIFFFLLATAFILIYLIHSIHLKDKSGHKWSLYTAIMLYILSIFIYLIEILNSDIIKNITENYWPFIFIIIGIYILINSFMKKSKSKQE